MQTKYPYNPMRRGILLSWCSSVPISEANLNEHLTQPKIRRATYECNKEIL